jgi:hypothetical protein
LFFICNHSNRLRPDRRVQIGSSDAEDMCAARQPAAMPMDIHSAIPRLPHFLMRVIYARIRQQCLCPRKRQMHMQNRIIAAHSRRLSHS